MRPMLALLPAVLCLAAAPATPDARPTLGVLDMVTSKGMTSDLVEVCNETLRDVAVSAAKYRVQDRAQMDAILGQQKINASDRCDESCAVEAGRLLQVSFLLSGSVRRLDTTYFVAVRLTDVTTGEVASTETTQCPQCSPIEVVNTVRKAAGKLLGVTGEVSSDAAHGDEPGLFARLAKALHKKNADEAPESKAVPAPEKSAPVVEKPVPVALTGQVKILSENSYQLELAASNGTKHTCDVSEGKPCELAGVPLGDVDLTSTGDSHFSQSITLEHPQATYKIEHRGRAPMVVGIVGVVLGVIIMGASVSSVDGSGTTGGLVVAMGSGGLIIWDAVRWHNKAIEQD